MLDTNDPGPGPWRNNTEFPEHGIAPSTCTTLSPQHVGEDEGGPPPPPTWGYSGEGKHARGSWSSPLQRTPVCDGLGWANILRDSHSRKYYIQAKLFIAFKLNAYWMDKLFSCHHQTITLLNIGSKAGVYTQCIFFPLIFSNVKKGNFNRILKIPLSKR